MKIQTFHVALLSVVLSLGLGARTLEENTSLTATTDWSDEALIVPAGVTLDLAGHRLKVASVTGAGTITDSQRYVPLEYVEANGSQYVKTGYSGGTNTSVRVEYRTGSAPQAALIFGGGWAFSCFGLVSANDSYGPRFAWFGSGSLVGSFATETRYTVAIRALGNGNGSFEAYDESGASVGTATYSLKNEKSGGGAFETCIFGGENGGNLFKGRIYSLTFSEGGEKVRDYAPARDVATSRIGFVDLVNGTFHASANANALAGGAELGGAVSFGVLELANDAAYPLAGFTGTLDAVVRTKLVVDADWSASGALDVKGRLDLAGHELAVAGLSGAGTIDDSEKFFAVDYIESNGGSYVETGCAAGPTSSVRLGFQLLENGQNQAIFGSKWQTSAYMLGIANNRFYWFGNGSTFADVAVGSNLVFEVSTNRTMRLTTDEGAELGRLTNQSLVNNYDDLMLLGYGGGYRVRARIRSFKLWEEGTLVRDYIPSRDPLSWRPGLFDTVERKFVYSSPVNGAVTEFTAPSANVETSVGGLRIVPTAQTSFADFTGAIAPKVRRAVVAPVALARDVDFRPVDPVAIDAQVDLVGHQLAVSALTGGGEVTDSNPRVYDFYDFVRSTGQQRVPIGFVPNGDSSVEFDFESMNASCGNICYFGGKGWETYSWALGEATGVGNKYVFFSGGTVLSGYEQGRRQVFTITPSGAHNKSGTGRIVDQATGTQLGSATINTKNDNNYPLSVFAGNNNANFASIKVYSMKLWDDGTLVRDLIPAREIATDRIGLYDKTFDVFYPNANETPLVAGTVTNDVVGVLLVDVPAGTTVTNNSVAVTGGLLLRKAGAGTLTAAKPFQDYTRGTEVVAGTLDTPFRPVAMDFIASKHYLGNVASGITIYPDGVFDIKGNFDYRIYSSLTLAGGVLRNTGSNQGPGHGSLGPMTLTADSTIDLGYDTTLYTAKNTTLDLNGHVLTIATGTNTFYFSDVMTVTPGTLVFDGTGVVNVRRTFNAPETDIRGTAALKIESGATMTVRDYYAGTTTDGNAGTGLMTVTGTFTPATDYFYGCSLADGAVVDLSTRTTAWSTTAASSQGDVTVDFAAGSTVTINAGARPMGERIVSWGAVPDDVSFILEGDAKASGGRLSICADGLYAVDGLSIMLK